MTSLPKERVLVLCHVVAAFLISVLLALLVTSEERQSPTADEPLHLVRGLSYWWQDDTRLLYAHPPLANAIQSFPAAMDDVDHTDITELPGWDEADVLELSGKYFEADYEHARNQMRRAREATMLWSVVFATFLYLWCVRHYGPPTAIVALSFWVLHPTIIAHGSLATTDLALAAAIFVALAAQETYARKGGWWGLVAYSLAVAVMCLIKHTGIILFGVLTVLNAAAAWRGWGRFEDIPKWRGLRRVARDTALVAVVAVFSINLIYRFEGSFLTAEEILATPEPHSWISKQFGFDIIRDAAVLRLLPSWVRLPLPYDYFAGLITVRMQNAMGHGDYFAGLRYIGHPAYFLVMLLVKTPVAMLAALGFGVREFARRWQSIRPTTFYLIAFSVLYLAIASTSRINIGVRHILPIFPVLCVLAGRACTILAARYALKGRVVVYAMILTTAGGTLYAFPHYIGDFNALTLGPRGGIKISVIGEEWGQDVGDLAVQVKERGMEPLYYSTRYSVRRFELGYQGVKYIPLDCEEIPDRPGWVALDLTRWIRTDGQCLANWLGDREPDLQINHHILVWQIPSDIGQLRARLDRQKKAEEEATEALIEEWRKYLTARGVRLPAPAAKPKDGRKPAPRKPVQREEPADAP